MSYYYGYEDTEFYNFENTQRKGDVGPKGSKGDVGPKGSKGDVGLTGPKGLKGDVGLTGPKGLKGDVGQTGLQGGRGNVGGVGSKGSKGDVGLSGPKGLKGDVGPKGLKGDVGLTGPKGLKGDVGQRGPQGYDGSDGVDGAKGPKGDHGDDGAKGNKGDVGLTGLQGNDGLPGNQGQTGLRGLRGLRGVTGTTGPAGNFTQIIKFKERGTNDYKAGVWDNTNNNSTLLTFTAPESGKFLIKYWFTLKPDGHQIDRQRRTTTWNDVGTYNAFLDLDTNLYSGDVNQKTNIISSSLYIQTDGKTYYESNFHNIFCQGIATIIKGNKISLHCTSPSFGDYYTYLFFRVWDVELNMLKIN